MLSGEGEALKSTSQGKRFLLILLTLMKSGPAVDDGEILAEA